MLGNLRLPKPKDLAIPGAPNVLQLKSMGPPPVIGPAPGKLPPIPRDDPFLQPFNLSVPGITVAQALTLRPSLTPSADRFRGGRLSCNYFIDAMNDSLRTRIPAADIAAIADSDPLVFDGKPERNPKAEHPPNPPSACVAPQAIGNPSAPVTP